MSELRVLMMIAGVCFFISGLIYLQISVWQECRAEHSFWYCINLMSGK